MVLSLQVHRMIKDGDGRNGGKNSHSPHRSQPACPGVITARIGNRRLLVAVARDAQEILGLLAQGKIPDLLILDLEIPYITEVNLLEQLKATYPSLPVIIHSFQPENPNEFIMAKTVAFLEKAEDPKQLKTTIAALVHK